MITIAAQAQGTKNLETLAAALEYALAEDAAGRYAADDDAAGFGAAIVATVFGESVWVDEMSGEAQVNLGHHYRYGLDLGDVSLAEALAEALPGMGATMAYWTCPDRPLAEIERQIRNAQARRA